jgi:hypothetical protein
MFYIVINEKQLVYFGRSVDAAMSVLKSSTLASMSVANNATEAMSFLLKNEVDLSSLTKQPWTEWLSAIRKNLEDGTITAKEYLEETMKAMREPNFGQRVLENVKGAGKAVTRTVGDALSSAGEGLKKLGQD